MEKTIDLHIHTNISDGALSPKEIIDEAMANAAKKNVRHLFDMLTGKRYDDEDMIPDVDASEDDSRKVEDDEEEQDY